MQRFQQDVKEDTMNRAQKAEAALQATAPRAAKILSRADADKFFQRLQEDGMRRRKNK